MAVFRVEKNKNYTTMSNYHLRDTQLSLKAKGLMSYMLSLPEDWDYSISGLASSCKEGKDAIRNTIQELEAARYIMRRQTHKEDGSFGGNEYVIFEIPQLPKCEKEDAFTGTAEHEESTPLSGNPTTVDDSANLPLSENPMTGKPSTGNPSSGNPTEQNTKRQSTKYIPPITPHYRPDWFESFYALYPRKTNRAAAVKAWDKLKPDLSLCNIMANALRAQINSAPWQTGKEHIPHPSTWLNNARWTDEVIPISTARDDCWAPDPEVY